MTPADIVSRVCAHRGVTVTQIKGPSRYAYIARARHEAQWLLREATEMSLPEIGRMFGKRDHSTVHSAVSKIQHLVAANPTYGGELLLLVARASIGWQLEALSAEIATVNSGLEAASAEVARLRERRDQLRILTRVAGSGVKAAA